MCQAKVIYLDLFIIILFESFFLCFTRKIIYLILSFETIILIKLIAFCVKLKI